MDVNKLKGKAQQFLKDHGEQIESGVSKAEKYAKSKTTKHGDKVDKMAGKIRGMIPPDEKPAPPAADEKAAPAPPAAEDKPTQPGPSGDLPPQ